MPDNLVGELGWMIANGELRSGTTFTLAEISDRFGLSRTVAREAMRVLEAKGMLEPKRRVGLEVREPDHWAPFDISIIGWRLDGPHRREELRSLADLRLAAARPAARCMAMRGEESDRNLLLAYAQRMCELAEDYRFKEYYDCEVAFQSLLFRSCTNRFFAGIADVVGELVRACQAGDEGFVQDPRRMAPKYAELAEVICAGDSDRAGDLIVELLRELSAVDCH
ncbi:MAG: FCD domain-containing protein [Bowdeniella nasicola]|nr:FCD domain-containing protein [Bowdeniella nasicola]